MTIDEAIDLAKRLRAAVDSLSFSPLDENEERLRDALAAAADRLRFVLERTPPAFVPDNWLEGIQGAFDPVIASVEARAGAEDADLTVTWAEVDRLWGAIAWFLPAMVPEESVSEDAAAYRRSAGQLIRRLTDEVSAARADLARFDFFVIERDVSDRHAEMVRLGREVRGLGVPIDIVVVSEAYAAEWAGVKNSIVYAALTEGRELAAA